MDLDPAVVTLLGETTMRTLLMLIGLAVIPCVYAQGIWPAYDFGVAVRALSTEVRIKEPIVPVSLPMPAYPAELARVGIRGEANIRFLIKEDGAVGEVEIVKISQEQFRSSVLEAVTRWKFQAYTSDGKQTIQKRVWMKCRILFQHEEE